MRYSYNISMFKCKKCNRAGRPKTINVSYKVKRLHLGCQECEQSVSTTLMSAWYRFDYISNTYVGSPFMYIVELVKK